MAVSDPATEGVKPHDTLILDTGPIIQNTPSVSTLLKQAHRLVTLPSVISEIRDEQTRFRVEVTLKPFLHIRDPRPESVKYVSDFARRTSDYAVLSETDLKVVALAYELHNEHASVAPAAALASQIEEVVQLNKANPRAASLSPPSQTENSDQQPRDARSKVREIDQNVKPGEYSAALKASPSSISSNSVKYIPGERGLQPTPPKAPDADQSALGLSELNIQETSEQWTTPDEDVDLPNSSDDHSDEASTNDTDDEGWITPSNLSKRIAADTAPSTTTSTSPSDPSPVATLTTDFALQNVLLQLNLHILSTTLQRIQHLRTTVLRCYGCFQLVRDTTKQFCPRCGQPTMTRVSATIGESGKVQVHLKKEWQWNHRGDKYSIPKPVTGTASGRNVRGGGKGGWGNELILTEDQKEYTRALGGNGRRKKEKDLMDEDTLPRILSGDRTGGTTTRPRIGAGKNVNAKRRSKK